MWSRLHNREETPFVSSAEDLFAFSLCPSLFCVFSSPSPPAFSKYHQTSSCHLVAHPVGICNVTIRKVMSHTNRIRTYSKNRSYRCRIHNLGIERLRLMKYLFFNSNCGFRKRKRCQYVVP